MVVIRVLQGLEQEIRVGATTNATLAKVLKLIDGVKSKEKREVNAGPSYKDLVGWFLRFCKEEGMNLVLPPKPSMGWIIRLVNRAKDIGLDEQSVQRVVKQAKLAYPTGPKYDRAYEFDWFIWNAPKLYISGEGAADTGVPGANTASKSVFTGRLEPE